MPKYVVCIECGWIIPGDSILILRGWVLQDYVCIAQSA